MSRLLGSVYLQVSVVYQKMYIAPIHLVLLCWFNFLLILIKNDRQIF